jgi:hypothetical protein
VSVAATCLSEPSAAIVSVLTTLPRYGIFQENDANAIGQLSISSVVNHEPIRTTNSVLDFRSISALDLDYYLRTLMRRGRKSINQQVVREYPKLSDT